MQASTPLLRIRWLLGLIGGFCAAPAFAAQSYLTLSSGYVFRGVELSDQPTLLLGAEQALGTGWFVGAWGVGVQRAWPFGEVEKGIQLGGYFGRDFGCGARCRARITASRYLHPDSAVPGWTEVSLSARYRQRFGASFAFSRDDAPFRVESRTVELFYERPLRGPWSGQLGLGHSDYGPYRYEYAELDLRRPLGRWTLELGLRHGRTLPPNGPARRLNRLLVGISLGF